MTISSEFPIPSQSCIGDREVLLAIRGILQNNLSYSYLEIGSYLGGSLTPFLKDPRCEKILSIDHRQQIQPDERGAKYDYSSITHETMLQNLRSHGLDTSKIETFDGSVSQYSSKNALYDFIFIDGEHTDWACFRDFVHSEKLFKHDCIVAFHDTDLIYKAIQNIVELLTARGTQFKFAKIKNSVMSCLFLNKYATLEIDKLFDTEDNLEEFYRQCENNLLLEICKHRVVVTNVEYSYSLKDKPVFKQ